MADCEHLWPVPVELLAAPHERVAWLCPECDAQLPADHIPVFRMERLVAQMEAINQRLAKLAQLGVRDGETWDKLKALWRETRAEMDYLSPPGGR